MVKKNNAQAVVNAGEGVALMQLHDLELGQETEFSLSITAYSEYIRSLQQNWRQGTVSCKDRSEVAFANRKPWKQKGTGRARAGSARSPLWRKGGVILGPQPRVRKLKTLQAVRARVMRELLVKAVSEQRVFVIREKNMHQGKTKEASQLLKNAGLTGKKVLFFTSPEDSTFHMAFHNIPDISLFLFDQPNAHMLSNYPYWACLEKDVGLFKTMVQAWI